ncbi:MAG: ATP-dependent protease [Planctomycetes bacterium]|nr:ATP-dependent protease [Planctomycetota bacterium]
MADAVDFDRPIPLFPLNQCVLMPHVAAPLHVFEPRYRAMTEYALEGSHLIALAVFAGEQWKSNYAGNPPLREHVCVGQIARHEEVNDGRYNLLLQGLCRARIVEELPLADGGYREAFMEPTESADVMEIDLSEDRQRIKALLEDELMRQLKPVAALHNWLEEDIPTRTMLDLAVMALCPGLEERYAMLAEPRADRRAAWVENHLRRTHRTLALAAAQGSATDEEGFPLN